VRLDLIGEVFNLFNVANLTGYSGVLNQLNYGQPTARAGQVFGLRRAPGVPAGGPCGVLGCAPSLLDGCLRSRWRC
jgi:hypothetical protein